MGLTPESHKFGNGEGSGLDALGRYEADEPRTVFLAHLQQVLAVGNNRSANGTLVTGERTQQGRFTCSVLSQQRDKFTSLECKVQVLEQNCFLFTVTVTYCQVTSR